MSGPMKRPIWRRVPKAVYYAVAVTGLVVALIVLLRAEPTDRLRVALAGLGWFGVFGLLGWRRSDEAVRTAHTSAWFWGGNIGTLVALIFVALILARLGPSGFGLKAELSGARDPGLALGDTADEVVRTLRWEVPEWVGGETATTERVLPGGSETVNTTRKVWDGRLHERIIAVRRQGDQVTTATQLIWGHNEAELAEQRKIAEQRRDRVAGKPVNASAYSVIPENVQGVTTTRTEVLKDGSKLKVETTVREAGETRETVTWTTPLDSEGEPILSGRASKIEFMSTAPKWLTLVRVASDPHYQYRGTGSRAGFFGLGLVLGLALTMLVQILGYGIAWVVWWSRRM